MYHPLLLAAFLLASGASVEVGLTWVSERYKPGLPFLLILYVPLMCTF